MRSNCRTISVCLGLFFFTLGAPIISFAVAPVPSSSTSTPMSAADRQQIVYPPLDSSARSIGGVPADVFNGIYGSASKEPRKPFATQCISPMQYNENWIIEATADENGEPQRCVQKASGAVGRTPNASGSGSGTAECGTRMFGDDEASSDGRGAGRKGACPKLLEKGQDVCKWWAEAMSCTSATLTAAARFDTPKADGKEGAPRIAFGTADIVCRQLEELAPVDALALSSTYDGTIYQPGTMAATSAVRNSINPNTPRGGSGFDNPTKPANVTLVDAHSFKAPNWSTASEDGKNAHYDRGADNPIRLAADVLVPQTKAYAVYDPSKKSLQDEQKLARELASKTPQEVAAIRSEKSGWMDAHASSDANSLAGIMCRLQPNTCQFSSHFDRDGVILESYFAGLARDNAISTPNIEFLPDLAQKFPDMINQVKAMGGDLVENMFANILQPASAIVDTLTSNEIVTCLNSMRTPALEGNPDELVALANSINANCPANLTGCLQSQGGYSGSSLNSCYLNINASTLVGDITSSVTGMSEVEDFIFNGNPNAVINGLTPSNLASLAGADVPLVNDLLMQRIPNMPTIAGLVGNAGQFFGNLTAMPRTLMDFKRNPYIQSFFGEHPFDIRAMTSMFPERDHYSPCAGDVTCYVSKTQAALAFFKPWYNSSSSSTEPTAAEYEAMTEAQSNAVPSDAKDCFGASCSDEAIGMPTDKDESSLMLPSARRAASSNSIISRKQELPKTVGELVMQLKEAMPPYALDPESLDNPNNPNSPLHFGPNPTYRAIGMPETTPETGPIIARKDGTVYYAKKPDEKINFILKSRYTLEDVKKGYLPKEFANFVPENHLESWDRLALIISEKGGIDFMPPERIDAMVAKINQSFQQMGGGGMITAEVLRQGAADFLAQPIQILAEDKTPPNPNGKVSQLLNSLGLQGAILANAHSSSLPAGATVAPANDDRFIEPSRVRDAIRCAGGKSSNQIRVDVLAKNYDRINGHILQRTVYNRWLEADCADPLRCSPFGNVCAPKPCPGPMGGCSAACWAPTHAVLPVKNCIFPQIKVGPSSEFPITSVRYDQAGQDDIGGYRRINNECGKVASPVGAPVEGECCDNGGGCNQVRDYNCRTYPNGKNFRGYTWAYHADVKYILDVWATELGGDFVANVGERGMDSECEELRAPTPTGNKLLLRSMIEADKAGTQIGAGLTYAGYFGIKRPCVVDDSTGMEFGQRPGQLSDPNDPTCSYVFINPSSTSADPTKIAKLSPLPNQPQTALASLLHRFAPQAFAAATSSKGHSKSNMPCVGGMGGMSIPNCPKFNGVDPQSDMLAYNLLQAQTVRDTGFNCQPHERFAWLKDGISMYVEMCGASIPVSIDGGGKGKHKNIVYPQPGLQNVGHPDGFNDGTFDEKAGVEAALALGDKAGCSIIHFANGMGEGNATGPDSKVSPPEFGVITQVNSNKGYIDAIVSSGGGLTDINGQTAHSERFKRRYYMPGKMPRIMLENFKADYGYDPNCYRTPPKDSSSCILSTEDVENRATINIKKESEPKDTRPPATDL